MTYDSRTHAALWHERSPNTDPGSVPLEWEDGGHELRLTMRDYPKPDGRSRVTVAAVTYNGYSYIAWFAADRDYQRTAHDALDSAMDAAERYVREYLANVQRVRREQPEKLAAMGAAIRARRLGNS